VEELDVIQVDPVAELAVRRLAGREAVTPTEALKVLVAAGERFLAGESLARPSGGEEGLKLPPELRKGLREVAKARGLSEEEAFHMVLRKGVGRDQALRRYDAKKAPKKVAKPSKAAKTGKRASKTQAATRRVRRAS
jgi:hypothetical protein